MKDTYGIIVKDFNGLTTYCETDNSEIAVNRPNVCRNWNSLLSNKERSTNGQIQSCIVFFSGEYDMSRNNITLYDNGFIVEEMFYGDTNE